MPSATDWRDRDSGDAKHREKLAVARVIGARMFHAAIVSVIITAAALGLSRPALSAVGDVIAGAAAVIDGDTIAIDDVVIRLFDVDAPEMAQTCEGGPSRLRSCGAYVADALAERLGIAPWL